ncbi:19988_t:CDS:2 [Funneliformis geosporum]|uniref:Phospholipid-transporting ATPase n=1 Tax=Funneliformis geosporum TaxID=1117311 RepID=A0A9W4SF18_9GLOM|nr:19988_t:CDS:2 [Funneliformis geosporum]
MTFFGRKKGQDEEGIENSSGSGHKRSVSTASTMQTLPKRRINVNTPLPQTDLDQYGEPKARYAANKIRTSKYTLLTFLPKNLFEQFRRVANMYFLFLVVLQLFPMIGGDVQPFLSATPLISIITMTAFKDAFEDWKRHSQDNSLNKSKTIRLDNWNNVNVPTGQNTRKIFLSEGLEESDAKWVESRWQDVKVGDFIKLKNNDSVPADMIILSTSEPDGLCYVETKELDGETNLKIRHGVPSTAYLKSETDCERVSFYVESEPPHANLYSYTGVLHWSDQPGAENNQKVEPISINDVILRGCVLRNTEWAICLVIFTGTDTKIMLNSGDTPSSAIADSVYYLEPKSSADFFEGGGGNAETAHASGFITFWVSLILFQNIVPISLYITIEMVKTVQAYFIYADVDLYYEKLDYPCTPKTWNISDDLGQIEYIFSDKTGTLTQNVMEFRKCTINGISYGLGETDTTRGAKLADNYQKPDSKDDVDLEAEKQLMLTEMAKLFDNRYISSNLTFIDSKFYRDLKAEDKQSKSIKDFFSALALCHTVLVEHPDENNPFNLEYKAQSPDEAALVGCARDAGFAFLERYQDTLIIEILGERKEFTLLNVLEFNSTRKRMSVILRPPEGGVVLLCKGADSVVYERLEKDRQIKLREETLSDLEVFANEGLRTLCIAYRVIPDEEYNVWAKKYAEAASSINDREEKIEQACEMIEHSLTLMGGTAIEDRLQEGVPECIATLAKAGIKIWVLTGDKTETAINIGFACNLLQKDMLLIVITASDKQSAQRQLDEALKKFFGPNLENKSSKHALIIDGETLKYALDKNIKPIFLDLGKRCQSVVCCRVSPLQKAKVVSMVKEGLNVMTLSIGDEANIGVGIAGEEGRQATMAADYAFAQFKFLEKLLLVHGRWSYIRIAEMISCFFYKNIVWTIAMFWYQIWAGFSAQYLYDYTYIMLYNLVFTAFPVMFLGAFDQDVDAKISLKYPQLYKRGILQEDFTKSKFWLYVVDAIYQSAVCFFVPFGLFQYGASHATGLTNNGLDDLGTLVAGAVVVTTNLYVGINIMNWTWLAFVVICISILSFYVWVEFYSIWASIGFFRMDLILFSELDFWLGILLAVFISILPRFTVKYLHKSYYPTDTDIIREKVKLSKQRRDFVEQEDDKIPITSSVRPLGTDSFNTSYATLSDTSLSDQSITKEREAPKLQRITTLQKGRTASIRAEEQLYHMQSGKRQSFTGFAFSSEESSFEKFRTSVYRPTQARKPSHYRSNTITTVNNNRSSLLSTHSLNRSQTLPSTLFRVSPSPSRSTSPNRSISDRSQRSGDDRRLRGEGEE